jgi:hypothetical protein
MVVDVVCSNHPLEARAEIAIAQSLIAIGLKRREKLDEILKK